MGYDNAPLFECPVGSHGHHPLRSILPPVSTYMLDMFMLILFFAWLFIYVMFPPPL